MINHIFSAVIDECDNLVVGISTSQLGFVKLVLEKRMEIHEIVGESGSFDIVVVEEDEAK